MTRFIIQPQRMQLFFSVWFWGQTYEPRKGVVVDVVDTPEKAATVSYACQFDQNQPRVVALIRQRGKRTIKRVMRPVK